MNEKIIPPLILFILTLIWINPVKEIKSPLKLLSLLLIDSLAFTTGFNLNFYKIYGILNLRHFNNLSRQIKLFISFISFFTLLSGFFFIYVHPELKDPISPSLLNEPIIRIFRNLFTIVSTIGFSLLIFNCLCTQSIRKIFIHCETICILLAIGIYIEVFFKIPLWGYLTGGNHLVYGTEYFRAKGFSFEPRGAAQVICLCLTATIFFSNRLRFYIINIFSMPALFFTSSMSGFAIIIAVYALIFVRSLFIKPSFLTKRAALSLAFFSFLFVVFLKMGFLSSNMRERSYVFNGHQINKSLNNSNLDPNRFYNTYNQNFFSKQYYLLINRLEVFDAAYLNFLYHEPMFLFTGTGSGMGGFASQKYVLEKDIGLFPNGSSALPLMGGVFIVSQFGIIITFILIYLFLRSFNLYRSNHNFFIFLLLIMFLLQYYYFLCLFFALIIYLIHKQYAKANR